MQHSTLSPQSVLVFHKTFTAVVALLVMLGIAATSCTGDQTTLAPEGPTQDEMHLLAPPEAYIVARLNDDTYSDLGIDQATLRSFLEEDFLVTSTGIIAGARFDRIEQMLPSYEASTAFWATFGVDSPRPVPQGVVHARHDCTFVGYKPKGLRGCKKNDNWHCQLACEVEI